MRYRAPTSTDLHREIADRDAVIERQKRRIGILEDRCQTLALALRDALEELESAADAMKAGAR